MLDLNNNYYNGHLERIIQKQILEVRSIHYRVINSFRSIDGQISYLQVIKESIEQFTNQIGIHLDQLRHLNSGKFIELNSYYTNNAENYKLYYYKNLLSQNYDLNYFRIGLLLFTADFNVNKINNRVDYIKGDDFDRVLFIFPESKYLWKPTQLSLLSFLNNVVEESGDINHLMFEIERNHVLEILAQSKILINFFMFCKNIVHIKLMLDKTLNLLKEINKRHSENLLEVKKLKNIDIKNSVLISHLIVLIENDFSIYKFEDEAEICDAINWILDKIDNIKLKLYNRYV